MTARQPAGIPIGGQFAADAKARSNVSLNDDGTKADLTPAEKQAFVDSLPGPSRFGEQTFAPEPVQITPGPTGKGQWQIASPTSENLDSMDLMHRLHASVSGGPAERRVRNTAAAELIRVSEDPEVVANKLDSLADMHSEMTVLCTSQRTGVVTAIEGRGHRTSDGRVMLLRKGSRTDGWSVGAPDGLDVVAVSRGYGGQQGMADAFAASLGKVPVTEPTNFEGIPSYSYDDDPDGNGPPSEIKAVFLYDHPGFGPSGESKTVGCMFLATDYDAENGIVNGYGWAPKRSGLVSEHGSMFAADLEKTGGRVTGYEPGAISFGDCVQRKLPPSRDEMYRAVQGQFFYDE